MQPLAILHAMILLMLANGAPIVAKKMFGLRFAAPLDAGLRFFDHRPLFGPAKTTRGILSSIVVTAGGAALIGLDLGIGARIAMAAMAGDLFSSFIKRRLGLPPSRRAVGLDQVPESLLPLLMGRGVLGLTGIDVAIGVAVFFVGEIILSRLLYRIHLRDEPY